MVIAETQVPAAPTAMPAPAQKEGLAEFFEANKGLVYKVSMAAMRRISQSGIAVDFNDIYQVASEAFIRCYQGYDPTSGFQFSTYFWKSAMNAVNAAFSPLIRERMEYGTVSVEEMTANASRGEDDEVSMADVVLKDTTDPQSLVAIREFLADVDARLSPLAKLILNWLIDPPDDLLEAIESQTAHAIYARSLGFVRRAPTLNLRPRAIGSYLIDIHGVDRGKVRLALEEIKQVQVAYAERLL